MPMEICIGRLYGKLGVCAIYSVIQTTSGAGTNLHFSNVSDLKYWQYKMMLYKKV